MPGVLPHGGLESGYIVTPIAEFRERVSLLDIVEVDDGHGGTIETEVAILDHVLASITQLTGVDLQYAQQTEPRATFRVCVRFDARVSASAQKLTYHDAVRGDRAFEIVAPPQDIGERRWELQLLCREADARAAADAAAAEAAATPPPKKKKKKASKRKRARA